MNTSSLNIYLSGRDNRSKNSHSKTDEAGLQLLIETAVKKNSLAMFIHCVLMPGISVSYNENAMLDECASEFSQMPNHHQLTLVRSARPKAIKRFVNRASRWLLYPASRMVGMSLSTIC